MTSHSKALSPENESAGTAMAIPIQIYYIPGSVTTDPPLEVDAAETVHSFYSSDGWFIASTKRYVPGAQNISLEFSCDKENFLNSAAVAQRVSPCAELAYREIINSAKLNEKFEALCENRDAVVTDYLTFVKSEWLAFAKKLNEVRCRAIERPNETESEDLSSLKSHLYQIKDHIATEVGGHPTHWKQALDTRQHALADCLGRIEIISQPCQSNLHGKSFLAQLRDVEDRYKKELTELEEDAACLRERHSQVEWLTVPRSLLYLIIALLRSDHPATCRFEEVGVVSRTEAEWENKLEKTNHLADDDYEGLAHTLEDFGHFEGVELTAERLKDQHKALMTGLRAMAGDMPSKRRPPPKSDKFSVSANIMILCACVRVFAIAPLEDFDRRVDFADLAARLSMSPLYKGTDVTSKRAEAEFDRIILFLQPEESPLTTAVKDGLELARDCNSLQTQFNLSKRLSCDDFCNTNGEKRQKLAQEAGHSFEPESD